MDPWIIILIVASTLGLVALLATRRGGPKVTSITRSTHSEDAEK